MAFLSLEKKVPLAMGIPVVLGILMTWSASVYNTYRTDLANDADLRGILQEQVLREFNHQVDRVDMVWRLNASDFQSAVFDLSKKGAHEKFTKLLMTVSVNSPGLPIVGYVGEEGDFLGVINRDGIRQFFSRQSDVCQYYDIDVDGKLAPTEEEAKCGFDWKKALEEVGGSESGRKVTVIDSMGSSVTVLLIAHVDEEGDTKGIFVGGINAEEIDRVFEASKLPPGGRALLLNGRGQPIIFAKIAHGDDDRSDDAYISTLANAIEQMMKDRSSDFLTDKSRAFTFDGHRYTIDVNFLSVMGKMNWKMAVLTAHRGWRQFDTPTTKLTLLFFGAGLLLAFWLGLRFARNISRPIVALDKASKELGDDTFVVGSLDAVAKRRDELGRLAKNFQGMVKVIQNREEHLSELVKRKTVELEKKASELEIKNTENESLLLNILPPIIAQRLKAGEESLVNALPEATIIFCDLVGFTKLSAKLDSRKLVAMLNKLFSEFDKMTILHGVEKIKTIGDAYMAVAGLPEPVPDHAVRSIELVMSWMKVLENFNAEMNFDLKMRVGINTGPVVAGVIGTHKFIYDLWGDAVNTASRMESHGIPDRIQVSETTYKKLSRLYDFDDRGEIEVKGKGNMRVFLLAGRKQGTRPVVRWVTRSNGHHDIVIGDESEEASGDRDWMDLLNSPVNSTTIRALLSKQIVSRRDAEPLNVEDKTEPPSDKSWDNLLKSEVSLKNIKSLLTKDIFSASSSKMAAKTSSKSGAEAEGASAKPLMKSAGPQETSVGKKEVEAMVASIESELDEEPLVLEDEVVSEDPVSLGDEVSPDVLEVSLGEDVAGDATGADKQDAAEPVEPEATEGVEDDVMAMQTNIEDQVHQLLLSYLEDEEG
jgi:class 3 adenylate cyclase